MKIFKIGKSTNINKGEYKQPLNIDDKPLKPEDDGKYGAKRMKPEDVRTSNVTLVEGNMKNDDSGYYISSILDLIVERENQEEKH